MDNLPDPAALRAAVEAEARRLQFNFFGVTAPDPPPHLPVFDAWLEAGRHGEMAYLASERSRLRRADPKQILPECRSILALGVRYASSQEAQTSGAAAPDNRPFGRTAAYAWGDDYHEVLEARLQSLAAFIEQTVGAPVPNRYYTDSGPLLERDLAQRAGLGWIGKNTCLIHPEHGSYFLLAEMLLGVDLAPDAPFVADRCGSCTRCLQACPTGCILPDRTIDAQRCISYLTIELKGPIPVELRPQIGDWIFGCDVCQQVCPWNVRAAHRAAPSPDATVADAGFFSRSDVSRPDLLAELALTPEAFNRKFKRSPVRRTKRRGYLRNVAIALGNQGDPAAVSSLARALEKDGEVFVRGAAAWALGQLGGSQAQRSLEAALAREQDPSVLAEMGSALANIELMEAKNIFGRERK